MVWVLNSRHLTLITINNLKYEWKYEPHLKSVETKK